MRTPREAFVFTSASPAITLFSSYSDPGRQWISLLASALVHAMVIGIVTYGIIYSPAGQRIITEHYSVRHLDLYTPAQQRAAVAASRDPVNQVARALAAALHPAPAASRPAMHAPAGPQTFLQPDLPAHIAIPEKIPIPGVLIWTPRKTAVKNIVAPQPAPPAAAETRPSSDAPNTEINLTDVSVTASARSAQKVPIQPGATTPVVVHVPSPVQLPPATVSQPQQEPTPVAVLSVSDLRQADGVVTLPPVNEAVPAQAGGTAPGEADHAAADARNSSAGHATADPARAAHVSAASAMTESAQPAASTGNGAAHDASTTHITLPRDGRFGAVIVGQSIADQFPEAASTWRGRMAYTVYLHVGMARSWILQYSLPRDSDAAAAGNANRLDAPWPYTIVRPNLAPDAINADALMVHGFVNQSGHFEGLSIVFPQASPQAPFILKSLEQWQFRPAAQNGQAAKVEVLLIIPEEQE